MHCGTSHMIMGYPIPWTSDLRHKGVPLLQWTSDLNGYPIHSPLPLLDIRHEGILYPPWTGLDWCWHLVVAIETGMVGKWMVCILMECCLVNNSFWDSSFCPHNLLVICQIHRQSKLWGSFENMSIYTINQLKMCILTLVELAKRSCNTDDMWLCWKDFLCISINNWLVLVLIQTTKLEM